MYQNEALKSDAGCISNTAPDICIAYKLHLECGRLINLVDWLEVCKQESVQCTVECVIILFMICVI